MMKKWMIILGCTMILSGCTERNIVDRGGELSPDFETRAGIEFDWQQTFDDMESIYLDDEEALSLAYFLNEEEDGSETIYLTAIVASGTLRSDADRRKVINKIWGSYRRDKSYITYNLNGS